MRPVAGAFVGTAAAESNSLLPYTGRHRARADRQTSPTKIRMQINKSLDTTNGPSTPLMYHRRIVHTLIARCEPWILPLKLHCVYRNTLDRRRSTSRLGMRSSYIAARRSKTYLSFRSRAVASI